MKHARKNSTLPKFWEVSKRIYYNPISGKLFWRFDVNKNHIWNGQKPWREVGHKHKNGYIVIGYNYRIYQAHRIAWLLNYGEWPEGIIDHVDCNRSNNSISNLRIASNSENCFHYKEKKRKNKHGHRGVFYRKDRGKYFARMVKDGRQIWLGSFDTIEEANLSYQKGAVKYFGEFYANE